MMKKKIASNSDPIVIGEANDVKNEQDQSVCPDTFPIGGRFLQSGKIWRVTESRRESNVEMRRISSSVGDDEIRNLKTLRDDLLSKTLRQLPDDEISKALQSENKK